VLTLEWAKEARDDLADIQSYIEQRNPQAAADLLDAIKRGAELLSFVPLAFRAGRVPGTREYPVHPNYILIYHVGKTTIEILRVLHGKRQYP